MKLGRKINLSTAKPGMVVEENIWDRERLLLAKGTIIKPSYIERLRSYGVDEISVYVDQTYYEELFVNPAQRFYAEAYEAVGNLLAKLEQQEKIYAPDIFPIVEHVLEQIFQDQESVLLLTGYRRSSGIYAIAHSLDVCIYSLVVGKELGLNYENIVTLGLGALLHDVGKTRVPEGILMKEGTLTDSEFEHIKKHSYYGYLMVRAVPQIKPEVAQIVLQHHERCDGSGYPYGLKRDRMDYLAKIVAVADIFDALTSDRVYRKKILPHEAAEYLLGISNSQIDWNITRVFIEKIAIYPKGCQVLLNTNEIGVVIDSNLAMPLRPRLKVISDKNGIPLYTPFEVDLSQNLSIFISDIFD